MSAYCLVSKLTFLKKEGKAMRRTVLIEAILLLVIGLVSR